MLLGYVRVSTDDQHLELQRDALHAAGCERLFEDRLSGARTERPGLKLRIPRDPGHRSALMADSVPS